MSRDDEISFSLLSLCCDVQETAKLQAKRSEAQDRVQVQQDLVEARTNWHIATEVMR